MNIFVFGGNGFVGKYLSLDLANLGHSVTICDVEHSSNHEVYKSVSFKNVDVRDIEQIRNLHIGKEDVVINLAANQYHNTVPKDAKDFFFSVNTYGTKNIIDVLEEVGCNHFIMYSTDMTYGLPQYIPVDVKHQQKPFGYYGASKYEAEQYCKSYRSKGNNCTIFRPRIIVGPGRLGILKKLFKLIDKNLPVPMIGSGNNHYQMISVFDCVSATIKAIEKGCPNDEFNLGSDNPPKIKELLRQLIKEAKSHSILIPTWGAAVKFTLSALNTIGIHLMYKEQYEIADAEYLVDIEHTKKELDWIPKNSDQDMIKASYSYYLNIDRK